MKEVIIVGAGIAGLSAALRLLERGFKVTMYEQDEYPGGMLRSYWDKKLESQREHSYHMFMNWYYNTWRIVDEIGARDNFTPRESFRFLYKGHVKDMPELVNPGGPQDLIRNLRSGAAPAPDLFLFMYSMIDLLSQPFGRDRFLDKVSVNGFLASRPYATEGMAKLHQKVWETVWAISSFQASAMSYKNFLKYGNRVPVPQLWLLKGNKWELLIGPLMDKLESFNKKGSRKMFEVHYSQELLFAHPTGDGKRIDKLEFIKVTNNPSLHEASITRAGEQTSKIVVRDKEVIIATTPGSLADLVDGEDRILEDQHGNPIKFEGNPGALYNADPGLGGVQYLESEPMASVELHLTKRMAYIPKEVTVFMDTPYQMTFLDYSQLWPDQKDSFLYITISDMKGLLSVKDENRDPDTNELCLDLDNPTTAIEYILREVKNNLDFEVGDIDLVRTAIQTNTGADLFANMVGSWDYRPETKTRVENLYIAGTYVRNFADVSTIEGAVVSGLNAAEAIREKHRAGDKIEVIYPDYYPEALFTALKCAWAPYAAAAKAWTMANDLSKGGERRTGYPPFPGSSNPGDYRDAPRGEDDLGSLFWDFLPSSLWGEGGKGVGPLFWNYGPGGRRR